MLRAVIAGIVAYWRSRAANIHGLILFLGGAGGLTALALLHVPNEVAQSISGACMVLGALLTTPGQG